LYKDQVGWLNKVLMELPEKQREVYHLREVEDHTYQEISEILDLNMNEVKVSLHRARTRIREKLEKIEAYGIAN
jgi:RNA polymerase sigma-70 factor (ECF subfamily)